MCICLEKILLKKPVPILDGTGLKVRQKASN